MICLQQLLGTVFHPSPFLVGYYSSFVVAGWLATNQQPDLTMSFSMCVPLPTNHLWWHCGELVLIHPDCWLHLVPISLRFPFPKSPFWGYPWFPMVPHGSQGNTHSSELLQLQGPPFGPLPARCPRARSAAHWQSARWRGPERWGDNPPGSRTRNFLWSFHHKWWSSPGKMGIVNHEKLGKSSIKNVVFFTEKYGELTELTITCLESSTKNWEFFAINNWNFAKLADSKSKHWSHLSLGPGPGLVTWPTWPLEISKRQNRHSKKRTKNKYE